MITKNSRASFFSRIPEPNPTHKARKVHCTTNTLPSTALVTNLDKNSVPIQIQLHLNPEK
jgi:hypothetical protein